MYRWPWSLCVDLAKIEDEGLTLVDFRFDILCDVSIDHVLVLWIAFVAWVTKRRWTTWSAWPVALARDYETFVLLHALDGGNSRRSISYIFVELSLLASYYYLRDAIQS